MNVRFSDVSSRIYGGCDVQIYVNFQCTKVQSRAAFQCTLMLLAASAVSIHIPVLDFAWRYYAGKTLIYPLYSTFLIKFRISRQRQFMCKQLQSLLSLGRT